MEKLVYLKIEKLTVFAKCWQSIHSSASAELCNVQYIPHFGFLNPHLLLTVRFIWRAGCWEFVKSDVCSFPCLPKARRYHIDCKASSCFHCLFRSSKQWIDFNHVYSWKHSCENELQLYNSDKGCSLLQGFVHSLLFIVASLVFGFVTYSSP